MSEIMNEIYYMITEQIGQQCVQEMEGKILLRRKCALVDEIVFRLGAGGEELIDGLTELDARLKDMQDKALFRAAVKLGAELARPEAGGDKYRGEGHSRPRRRRWAAKGVSKQPTSGSTNRGDTCRKPLAPECSCP